MSDEDVNKLVGTSESCQLPVSHQTTANFAFTKYEWVRKVEGICLGSIRSQMCSGLVRISMWLCPQEMEPPNALQCELRSYQKQALHWMTQLEIGLTREDAADTLHPCWEAYHLAEGYSSLPFLSYGSRAWKGFIQLCTGCFLFLHIFSINLQWTSFLYI